MSETGFVYTLSDPRTDNVRYVGATINPEERLKSHISAPHSDRLSDWVDDLEDEDVPVLGVTIGEGASIDEATMDEMYDSHVTVEE